MLGSVKRILLISDDKNNEAFLNNLAQKKAGIEFEVNQVNSIDKAIGEINVKDYDLIVLDIATEDNCVTAAERICSANSYVPIIVLTHKENKNSARAFRKNISQIIRKDYLDPDMITDTILSVIDRKKYRE